MAKKLEFSIKMEYSIGVLNFGYSSLDFSTPLLFHKAAMFRCWLRGGIVLLRTVLERKCGVLRRNHRFLLAFCWILGIACGCCVFASGEDYLCVLMRRVAFGPVSIVSLIVVSAVPFLIFALCATFSLPVLCYAVCFAKAVSFSLVSLGILVCFGSAGWLCRYLLLFSGCAGAVLVYLYWLRHVSDRHPLVRFCWLFAYVTLQGLLCLASYYFVLPLWADLILFWKG